MNANPVYQNILNESIFVSGIPRSGTSMLGSLLASCKNVEYGYEVPMLGPIDFSLSEQSESNNEKFIELLIQYTLCHDVILNHVQGRNFNVRPDDFSSIFRHKEYSDILGRWCSPSSSKSGLDMIFCYKHRMLVKITGRFYLIKFALQKFPGLKVVEIRRDLEDIAHSLFKKNWFSHADDTKNSLNSYSFIEENVPYFLDMKDRIAWQTYSDPARAAKVAISLAKKSLEFEKEMPKERFHVVWYEELILNPSLHLAKLIQGLKLTETNITKTRLDEIKKVDYKNSKNQFLSSLDFQTKNDLKKMNNDWLLSSSFKEN